MKHIGRIRFLGVEDLILAQDGEFSGVQLSLTSSSVLNAQYKLGQLKYFPAGIVLP